MKKRVLKNYISFILYSINVILIMLDIMLIAELNTTFLFYSISINIVVLNTYIIHNFSSKNFIKKYMYILTEEE